MGIARSSYYKKQASASNSEKEKSDKQLLAQIKSICKDHPFWGYRRVTSWLRRRLRIHVNRKRVFRIMQEHNLLVKQKRYKAKRTPTHSKPKPTHLNQWWGIDMTKFLINSVGWVYFVVVLDWYSRKIVGYNLSLQSKTADWLNALYMAVNNQCVNGSREHHLHLMSDNGSQPTSKTFLKECKILNIQQTFTSYNNPKGNANTERILRTIKEDCIWINEWGSLKEAQKDIEQWIFNYNHLYPHSMLNDLSPVEFEQMCTKQKAA